MLTDNPIRLTYFDCRGRGQFIRHFLACRGAPFHDDRVGLGPTGGWTQLRDQRGAAGPFRKLPVLRWGVREVAELGVIAAFLHEISGDRDLLSTEENLRHAMLVSSLHTDLMIPTITLVWADMRYPGVEMAMLARKTLERLEQHLTVLDCTLDEWQWLQSMSPTASVADCFLWEELAKARGIFGAALDFARWPVLARFMDEFAGRAVCERVLEATPSQITGRLNEAAAIAAIRRHLGQPD